MTVAQAASYLGISSEAVRSRIQRGTLEHHKEGGRTYVMLAPDHRPDAGGGDPHRARPDDDVRSRPDEDRTGDSTAVADELREHNAYLREIIATRDQELRDRTEELRRKDHIIAALTERIPELEPPAPQETPETPGTAAAGGEGTETPEPPGGPETATRKPSWWRRFFGFE